MRPINTAAHRHRLVAATALVALMTLVGREVGWAAPAPSPAASPTAPSDDPGRGLRYEGLHRQSTGRCAGQFEASLADGGVACTHGPDPAPTGVDVRQAATVPVASAQTAAALATVPCQGDGVSGPRVQLVYAHAAGVADRYSSFLSSFQLWAAEVDDVFNQSAAETGGSRHIRFVADPTTCVPTVLDVTLSATGDDNLTNTINELRAQGYNRSDRKYLVWVDANVYCGIAQVYNDDRATQDNYNNGSTSVPGMVARVDNGCWGNGNALVEAHELTHTLGGVQTSAPHATANNHCTDDYDRMCYSDAAGVTVNIVCPDTGHENRLDCNHDDYYSTAPAAGSYLATHWNVANSAFLAGGGTSPTTTTTIPPTTTTTRPPTTTTIPPTTTTTRPPTTTTTVPATTTTTRPPTTTTTRPPTTTTTVPPAQSQSARFVDRAYQDLLGRPPTASESSIWTSLLASGVTRTAMAQAIVGTTEYRSLVVSSYYQTFLGRPATSTELTACLNAITAGWVFDWIEMVVVGSDEFYALHGSTPGSYVDALYTGVLGLWPDAAGHDYWVNQLTSGAVDRYTVALAFIASSVAHWDEVYVGYEWLLRRAPTPAEATSWVAQLDGGMRQETFFAFLVGSDEYWSKV